MPIKKEASITIGIAGLLPIQIKGFLLIIMFQKKKGKRGGLKKMRIANKMQEIPRNAF